MTASRFQKRFGIRPLPQLALEVTALVDEDLSVFGEHDAHALERTRRRPFEVHAGRAESAPVARAFDFVFCRKIVRRASEVRARRAERVEPAGVLVDVVGGANEPDAEFLFPALV